MLGWLLGGVSLPPPQPPLLRAVLILREQKGGWGGLSDLLRLLDVGVVAGIVVEIGMLTE